MSQGILIIASLLASRLEAAGKIPNLEPTLVSRLKITHRMSKQVLDEFEKFDRVYVQPLFSLDPDAAKRYLDDIAPSAFQDFTSQTVRFMAGVPVKSAADDWPVIKEAVLSLIDAGRSLFDPDSVRNFREALTLELDNETYTFRNHMLLLAAAPEVWAKLSAAGLDAQSWAQTGIKLLIALYAYLDAIIEQNRTAGPLIANLSRIALECAEENDSFVTTVDILLDREKESDLMDAYSKFERTVEQPR